MLFRKMNHLHLTSSRITAKHFANLFTIYIYTFAFWRLESSPFESTCVEQLFNNPLLRKHIKFSSPKETVFEQYD